MMMAFAAIVGDDDSLEIRAGDILNGLEKYRDATGGL